MLTPILDIHCHPILKTYLFGAKLDREQYIGTEVDIQAVQTLYTSFPRLKEGNVRGIISYGYVPERRLKTKSGTAIINPVWSLIQGVIPNTADKVEGGISNTKDCFDQTTAMLLDFEALATSKGAKIARNYQEVEKYYGSDQREIFPLIIHALEGGHHIGRPAITDKTALLQEYQQRLRTFAGMGVAVLTIAHFFDNVLVASGGGLPPDIMAALRYPIQVLSEERGLSAIGAEIVQLMWELGIILDLTHCPPTAREQIYKLHKKFGGTRPLIFSHTGVRAKFVEGIPQCPPEHQGYAQHDAFLVPSDAEIKTIASTGGVIGVICMQYWLKGYPEANTPRLLADSLPDTSLEAIIGTIQHICTVTGSSEHVSLGTDFDGFTDVPDDIPHAGYIQKIVEGLKNVTLAGKALTQTDVENIMYKNALRVLKFGWGTQGTPPSPPPLA